MLHSLDECEVASLPKSELVAGILLLAATIWLIINCKLINTWREEKCNSRPCRRVTCFTIQNTRKRGRWTFRNAFYLIPYLSSCTARRLSLKHILALFLESHRYVISRNLMNLVLIDDTEAQSANLIVLIEAIAANLLRCISVTGFDTWTLNSLQHHLQEEKTPEMWSPVTESFCRCLFLKYQSDWRACVIQPSVLALNVLLRIALKPATCCIVRILIDIGVASASKREYVFCVALKWKKCSLSKVFTFFAFEIIDIETFRRSRINDNSCKTNTPQSAVPDPPAWYPIWSLNCF